MKIAIDCRMIGSGGIGTYISELIPYFLKKCPCLLIGTHEQCMAFLRLENAEFCYCNVKPFSFAELFSFPSDVLSQINDCTVFYTPYCNIPGGITIPVYSTIHDVVFLDIKSLTSFHGRLLRKWFYQRAITLSEAVFTVSEFSKERILKNLSCSKPVIVGYNAVPSWISAYSGDTPAKTDTILFVGNIKPHKGLRTLVEAFSKVRSGGLNAKLVIVGNADNFRTGDPETVKAVHALPPEIVSFTGKISNENLKQLYQEAKILVQPSLYEGFGIPPLEALACGTNVILSDIPVFHEIYAGYPVTYFTAGDSGDLAAKINQVYTASPPSGIPDTYSYKNTAETLLDVLQKGL